MRRYHSIHQLVLLAALGLLCCSTDRVDDGGDPTPPPAAADLRYPVVESDYMPSRQQTGDMIPDFSRVGYRWGDRAIPDVAVVETLTPPSDGGDATALIQQAIDRTQSGAILLKRGVYRISGTIRINRSGIVLRGEGEGEDGTLLVAAGTTKRDLVVIGGSGSRRVESNTEAYDILDDYVPAGRFWVRSPRAGEFRVGDNVVVYRPSTREWISDLKMDQIPPRADGLPITQWEPGRFDTYAERVITLIKGDTLHFENPVVMSLDRKYGGGRVLRYSYADRIEECGVENLRFDSDYTDPEDENHGWNAVAVKVAAHCWVRNVTSLHFGMGLVTMDQYAKNISVLDCTCLEPVSTLAGSRRYSFHISQGQLCLVKDCTSEDARHDYATGSLNCGPNVFTSCRAKRPHADIGPHQRWNTGTLYDCVIRTAKSAYRTAATTVRDRGGPPATTCCGTVRAVRSSCRAPGSRPITTRLGPSAARAPESSTIPCVPTVSGSRPAAGWRPPASTMPSSNCAGSRSPAASWTFIDRIYQSQNDDKMKKLKFLALPLLGLFALNAASARIVEVAPGDDLRSALKQASAADTLLLKSGEYALSTQIVQTHDIVLLGEEGEKPVVHFTNFVLGTGSRRLVLGNLHIIYDRKYLVYNDGESEVDIDEITLSGCIVNLNDENGASLVLNRSTAAKNRIGRITIDDCIVYNSHAPSHGVVNIGKESTVQLSSITLRNSTFADFVRGAVIVSAPMQDLKIDVENCTYYDINTSENSGAIFHAAGHVSMRIARSIFHLPGASPKFVDAGSGGRVEVVDSYRTDAQPRVRNPYGLKTLSGDARATFASATDDPLDGCTSYRIVDPALQEKGIGDPRWR